MANREVGTLRFGLIMVTSIIGAILYFIVAAGVTLLFINKTVPIEGMGIISKIMLLAISMIVTKIIKGKVKTEKFINSMSGAIIFCMITLVASSACRGWEINAAGVVICELVCIIGCFILFIKDDKYGKMHKKRRKR